MIKKSNVILLCFSVVFSLYVFELGTYLTKTFYYSEHSPASFKRINAALKQGRQFDTRTRLQFILDNEKVGIPLSPRIPPSKFNKTNGLKTNGNRLFPLAGLSNRRTVYCNNYGDYLLYQSDEWGLRNLPGIDKHPLDLMIVGDSFSMGHCVERGIASLLRKSDLTSMSVAYSGNGPLIELATIREYASQLSPKIVLWIYYEGNDLRDLSAEKKSSLLMRYLDPDFSQKLVGRQPEIDLALESYVEQTRAQEIAKSSGSTATKLTAVRVLLKKNLKHLVIKKKNQSESGIDLFKQVLTQAEKEVASWGGQMVFVYLPDWVRFQYPDRYREMHQWLKYRTDILTIAKELGMPTVDITEKMSLSSDPTQYYPYGLRGHYTEEGYALVTEQIIEALSENGLLNESTAVQ